jgi:hypothetical protein
MIFILFFLLFISSPWIIWDVRRVQKLAKKPAVYTRKDTGL